MAWREHSPPKSLHCVHGLHIGHIVKCHLVPSRETRGPRRSAHGHPLHTPTDGNEQPRKTSPWQFQWSFESSGDGVGVMILLQRPQDNKRLAPSCYKDLTDRGTPGTSPARTSLLAGQAAPLSAFPNSSSRPTLSAARGSLSPVHGKVTLLATA